MSSKIVINQFWSVSETELIHSLDSSFHGLSTAEANMRISEYGRNEVKEEIRLSKGRILWNQLKSHLLWILIIAAVVSMISGEWVDSSIIMLILAGSVGIGYSREFSAQVAVRQLKDRLQTKARVLRDGVEISIDVRELVPGDVFVLSAGSLVPADARVLTAKDLFINEAVMTGESFPVEKEPAVLPPKVELSKRLNSVFMGTNVRAGIGTCVVVRTGPRSEYGGIAKRLSLRAPETEFERGIRKFGDFLTIAMLAMTLIVFIANLILERPMIESLLFSIALAVGLSPELLPAILNVNLATAANLMAKKGVIVRNLNAIENLGSMTVLCTDKTGTLTEGVVELSGAYDWHGVESTAVLSQAAINALLQTGLKNPLDEAIAARVGTVHLPVKFAEIPYDFIRKRMSVIIESGGRERVLITKGAFPTVMASCTMLGDGSVITEGHRDEITKNYEAWSSRGIRVLAVATKRLILGDNYTRDDEEEMSFLGFLTFLDRPKLGVADVIKSLEKLGVGIKIITGDSKSVAQNVARAVGLDAQKTLTGKDLDELHDEALWHSAIDTTVFAEVDPNQKERIILSLKKMGAVVGFLGDGVNDAPAMHAADTSLSVDSAVDVARDVADFVLLERDLDVIKQGIEQGRKTFANTLKYILITMSANLGNMISMAVASLFLPFLPLLAGQVLLNNFLSDIPAIGIAADSVDDELVAGPGRWDMSYIKRFMIEFGLVSSFFDFVIFGVLIVFYSAGAQEFRTTWFVESLLTELVVALVVRTRRPVYKSSPGRLLLKLTVAVGVVALAIPYLPFAGAMGFVPLSADLMAVVLLIVVGYVFTTELLKALVFRRETLAPVR
ncbi:MAG: magnesium-translocating P-type ATPase [bacterium]